jgi:hypothetical protein
MFDPDGPETLVTALADAASRRDELRAVGLERAAAFTWRRAAEATDALIGRVLNAQS